MIDTDQQAESGYSATLQRISQWPVSERLALVQDILRTVSPLVAETPPVKHTWEQASGLLAGPWPTPSDEDVERWLDERRQAM
ncbi:MAG: hypothetical protein ACRDHP_02470 [Ktedonobacterales bacterium]